MQQEGAVVTMKMAREQEHPARMKSEKKGKKGRVPGVSLSETDEGLFEKLRALRTEIAKEENVPPYIVFSDKTLVSMCMVKPRTKAEMLTVSGVGEFKFDKYGGRFLDCVTAAAGGPEAEEANLDDSCYDGDDLYFSSDSDGFDDWNLETAMAAWETSDLDDAIIPVNDTAGTLDIPEKKKKTKNSKTEFIMTEELADQVHYSEKVTLSDFIGQINDLRDEDAMKRLTIKSVEQWLTDSGNFEVWFLNGTPRKRLTGQGEDFGIEAEKRLSEKGNEYDVFYYTEKAQRQIVRWLLKAG